MYIAENKVLTDGRTKNLPYNWWELQIVSEKTEELNRLLEQWGYANDYQVNKLVWTLGEFPTLLELQNYLGNVTKMKEVFFTVTNPSLPNDMRTADYAGLNAIEKALEEIEYLMNRCIANFPYAGGFMSICGSSIMFGVGLEIKSYKTKRYAGKFVSAQTIDPSFKIMEV